MKYTYLVSKDNGRKWQRTTRRETIKAMEYTASGKPLLDRFLDKGNVKPIMDALVSCLDNCHALWLGEWRYQYKRRVR